jgi:tetratricopeptide (TPR) repeat protein
MAHVGRTDPAYRAVAYGYAGVMLTADDPAAARGLLFHALAEGGDPGAHPFVGKYGPGIRVGIAPGVEAHLPFGRDALGLALAELHQAAGDLRAAIEVVERVEPTIYAGVSLAELYGEAGRHQDVVDLTNGLRNGDDTTALLLVYHGAALRELGFHEASREAFKEALKSKARDQDIRHLALSERARTYEAENKKAMARKDLERILAENAGYEGVRERLTELA